MKFFKWFAITFFFLLFIGISAIQAIRVAAGPWPDAPAKTVRLKPLLPPLAMTDVTSSNGYYFLDQLASTKAISPTLIQDAKHFANAGFKLDGQPHDFPEAIASNAVDLVEAYRRANAAPMFQMPFEPHEKFVTPHVQKFIRLPHVLGPHLYFLAQEEDWDAFEACMEDSIMVAHKLRRGGPILSHLIATLSQSTLLDAIAAVSEQPETPAHVHASIERMYQQMEKERVPFSESWRYEHMLVTNNAAKIYNGGFRSLGVPALDHTRVLWGAFGSNPQTTQANLDRIASNTIHFMESPYDSKRLAEYDESLFNLGSGWRMFGSDPVGRAVFKLSATSVTSCQESLNQSLVAERSNRTINAMHRYKKREGKWPAKLKDLVPKDLAAVPLDSFDAAGAPMRYVPPSRIAAPIVYSIGPDQKDDGGGTGYKSMGMETDLGRAPDWFGHLRKKP